MISWLLKVKKSGKYLNHLFVSTFVLFKALNRSENLTVHLNTFIM